MQQTLRRISKRVDSELRRRAAATGQSLNAVALEALERGLGLAGERQRRRSLDDVAGSWEEDREFDQALKDFRKVERRMWR